MSLDIVRFKQTQHMHYIVCHFEWMETFGSCFYHLFCFFEYNLHRSAFQSVKVDLIHLIALCRALEEVFLNLLLSALAILSFVIYLLVKVMPIFILLLFKLVTIRYGFLLGTHLLSNNLIGLWYACALSWQLRKTLSG